DDQNQLNELNARLMENVNATGKYYFTHTKLNGDYVIRFVIGQENTEEKHVFGAWKMLQEFAEKK
ncbi:MAG: amino acid decarboxylase, partial [Calditrichaeota bacterium]|nr:amino acid decarboxylase [Calditrichota bacterium]